MTTPNPDPLPASKKDGRTITDVLPFADHRDLYVLIVGLVIGILLSKGFLGAVAPNFYHQVFVGGLAQQKALVAFEEKAAPFKKQVQAYQAENPESPQLPPQVAQQAFLMQLKENQLRGDLATEQSKHAAGMLGILLTLFVALVMVSVLETQVIPNVTKTRAEIPPMLGRLTRLRYVILAGVLALVTAQPTFLKTIPIVFAIILIGFILVAGLLPFNQASNK